MLVVISCLVFGLLCYITACGDLFVLGFRVVCLIGCGVSDELVISWLWVWFGELLHLLRIWCGLC